MGDMTFTAAEVAQMAMGATLTALDRLANHCAFMDVLATLEMECKALQDTGTVPPEWGAWPLDVTAAMVEAPMEAANDSTPALSPTGRVLSPGPNMQSVPLHTPEAKAVREALTAAIDVNRPDAAG